MHIEFFTTANQTGKVSAYNNLSQVPSIGTGMNTQYFCFKKKPSKSKEAFFCSSHSVLPMTSAGSQFPQKDFIVAEGCGTVYSHSLLDGISSVAHQEDCHFTEEKIKTWRVVVTIQTPVNEWWG